MVPIAFTATQTQRERLVTWKLATAIVALLLFGAAGCSSGTTEDAGYLPTFEDYRIVVNMLSPIR